MKENSRIGYMCATDFDFEVGEAPGGIQIYRSKEDALAHRSCIRSCGLVKVKIMLEKVILKSNLLKGASK